MAKGRRSTEQERRKLVARFDELRQAGMSVEEAADKLNVAPSTYYAARNTFKIGITGKKPHAPEIIHRTKPIPSMSAPPITLHLETPSTSDLVTLAVIKTSASQAVEILRGLR
jgi:hypothetical protein